MGAAANDKAVAAAADKKVAAAAADKKGAAASEKKKPAATAGKKKASAATATAAEKKKASAAEKKKASSSPAAAAKESKKQPSNIWTKAQPKFKNGQAILTDAELLGAGPSIVALHTYYMKGCQGNKKNGIVVKYKRQHFLRDRDIECFLVGFDDLYDLFKLDALDVSLLRCFTL